MRTMKESYAWSCIPSLPGRYAVWHIILHNHGVNRFSVAVLTFSVHRPSLLYTCSNGTRQNRFPESHRLVGGARLPVESPIAR